MKIIERFSDEGFSPPGNTYPPGTRTFLSIGNFDGIHKGHQQLLKRLVTLARENQALATVITFSPHPLEVLFPEKPFLRIMDPSHKEKILESIGVDILTVVPFTKELSKMNPDEFTKNFLNRLFPLVGLIIGENFRFGHERAGSVSDFKRLLPPLGVSVEVIPPIMENGSRISSSRIRDLIRAGDVREAGKLLTRPFQIEGPIIDGERRGRRIGFPTINILPPQGRILPPNGVYATVTRIQDKIYPGVSYIGSRPTFGQGQIILETHLFDFEGDLYGLMAEVSFIEHLRGEKSFSGPQELINSIRQDSEQSRKLLNELPG
ncbi:MAG: bifunctional riboflavin kinase/FAD synthetase [Leptospirillum sp.]|jgi:riboflavin kinase/FMN adenylyltransferase